MLLVFESLPRFLLQQNNPIYSGLVNSTTPATSKQCFQTKNCKVKVLASAACQIPEQASLAIIIPTVSYELFHGSSTFLQEKRFYRKGVCAVPTSHLFYYLLFHITTQQWHILCKFFPLLTKPHKQLGAFLREFSASCKNKQQKATRKSNQRLLIT